MGLIEGAEAMAAPPLQDRVQAIERLTNLFRAERIVYLFITAASLVLLLISAAVLIVRSQASAGALTMIFGSSGLMGISVARVLRMWERAFDMLESAPQQGPHSALGRASRVTALATAFGAAIVVGSLAYSTIQLRRRQSEVSGLTARADSLRALIAQRESTLRQLTPAAARGLGYVNADSVANPDSLAESLKANQAAGRLMAANKDRRRRVTIRYYPREFERAVNQDLVLPALREAGFNLEQRPTAPGIRDVETNAMWLGAGVNPDDARLVALILTSAGVRVRAIREFRDPFGPRRTTIEIGADRAQVASPIWTTERILNAVNFARDVT